MLDDGLNHRELYMRRILWLEGFDAPFRVEDDRFVCVHGEAEHSLVTNDFDTVFLGRFVCDEAPGTGAWQAGLELEAGTDGIFHIV